MTICHGSSPSVSPKDGLCQVVRHLDKNGEVRFIGGVRKYGKKFINTEKGTLDDFRLVFV